jgi:transglutaminase-like putative cysteine protease
VVPHQRRRTSAVSVPKPAGCSPGAPAVLVGWVGMVLITVLMGSSAGVMLAVPTGLGVLWAAFAGLLALRGVTMESLQIDDTVVGQRTQVRVQLRHRAAVGVLVESLAGQGWVTDGDATWLATAQRRGRFDTLGVTVRSAGRPALVWWSRTLAVPTGGWSVSAAPQLPGAPLGDPQHSGNARREGSADQLRPWADGDLLSRVHWPSSSRSATMIVRQPDQQPRHAVVLVAADATDADAEAGRVVATAEALLHDRARVTLRSGSSDVLVADSAALRQWSAAFGPRQPAEATVTPWYRRHLHVTTDDAPGTPGVVAHLLTAVTRAAACWFLLRGLAVATVGSTVAAAGALAPALPLVHERSRSTRTCMGGTAALAVMVSTIDPALVTQPHQLWRAALPQLLVALVVLHGFDAPDRRGMRVGTAFSALVATYAAAIRMDGDLLVWCIAIGALVTAAIAHIGTGSRPSCRRRSWTLASRAVPLLAVGAASIALLNVIPVPNGPNRLLLPTFVTEGASEPLPGQLVDASGNTPVTSSGGSASQGSLGGYPGFAEAMDTAWRGDLGDDIVLRVRSPYPDFWRGQTFGEFDGRTWTPVGGDGWQMRGPYIDLGPVFGDRVETGDDTFTQTFTAEVDLGNLLFAASQAEQVVFDGDLWRRPDGALRAATTLPAGTVYTVISSRSGADPATLRADGVIDYSQSPSMVQAFGPYLRVPESTSARTRQLARSLAAESTSTYDTVRAMERWLGEHVTYSLDAPVPPPGSDSVDHFLFDSRQGFCEQISSSLAVMLRSLGVPARIATGYVPGERDAVSGTWVSRASDAHAWVEVYFPSVGWQAFDPTASVPLQGESSRPTVGDGLWSEAAAQLDRTAMPLVVAVTAAMAAVGATRGARRLRRWHRRGRWGRLQDRFVAAAVARGAPAGSPNQAMAGYLGEPARAAATALDAAAFDPEWRDDPATFERAADLVDAVTRRQ